VRHRRRAAKIEHSTAARRTRNQERRASARRGRRNAHATAFVSHGWLTPAAPDRATNIHCKARACRCTNARAQERRASARRGVRHRRRAAKIEHSTATTNTQPGAAGVRPPWSAKRPATAFVSHGWLTPAAPDRATNIHRKARACRCTNARAQERRASARRGRRHRRRAAKIEHSTATNEHATRSGGRQPAVVGETPMQRRSFPTAGLRQPLLIGRTSQRLRTRNQERRASARRGVRHRRRAAKCAWLTPAAPDRVTNIHCKARACRCTNARAQERRASARRGVRYRRRAGKVEHATRSGGRQHRTATNEHATRSGGRQPAVVGETPMQRRSFPTAGLRQPLLIGRRTFTAKRVLADAQTHVPRSGGRPPWCAHRRRAVEHSTATNEHATRSGGRQPAVVGETPMQRRSFPTAGLRQPLLIGRRTFTAKRVLADAQTHVPRSGEAMACRQPTLLASQEVERNRGNAKRVLVMAADSPLSDIAYVGETG
jgi:hypothetical protein